MTRSSGASHDRVVEERVVLHEFAQADAAGVRAHRNAELGRQQQLAMFSLRRRRASSRSA